MLQTVDGCDRNFAKAVYAVENRHIDPQQPVTGGLEVDTPFPGFRACQVAAGNGRNNARGGIIFVNHAGQGFKNIKMLFANLQQHLNVFFPHNMAFAKNRPFAFTRNNSGDVVTQNTAHGVMHMDGFHCQFGHDLSRS